MDAVLGLPRRGTESNKESNEDGIMVEMKMGVQDPAVGGFKI